MRKTRRLFSQVGPEERLANAIAQLPTSARRALSDVADREDLPLVAGVWGEEGAGCLVANVVRAAAPETNDAELTLDLRILELFPELSSRELNLLIVAWDEAALQEGRTSDGALRRLLRGALARAGVPATAASGSPMAEEPLDDPAADAVSPVNAVPTRA